MSVDLKESCDKASNCLCRPALVAVVDINMRSSAYSPECQERVGASMPAVSSRCLSKPSPYRPKSDVGMVHGQMSGSRKDT